MINQTDKKENNYYQENSNTPKEESKEEFYKRNNRENISNIINRRNKILNHIKKEQTQINMPDTRPFQNEKHAVECLMPYHIFLKYTPEDFMFLDTKIEDKVIETDSLVEQVESLIKMAEKKEENGYTVILDLMDLEAHKFIHNKYTTTYSETFDKINNKNLQIKKKKVVQKKLPIIKIQISDILSSYKYVRAVNGKLFFKRK
ncbi:hypothetical protein TUBRATIS_008290 [Tubulinosema ratisbonensis]|uniref:GLTSCR protein conserved domain-containing protein n=1 Tax=Tubulinosema ratisbonensis TaxID=291195 RepID=A0A437ANB6_9MICR|nr:hypothetical protein TUBRATIS_008290 [Tubulinosema ratisbonensis]